jgi:hypothetical protein
MEMNATFHAPAALTSGKELLLYKLAGHRSRSGRCGEQKNLGSNREPNTVVQTLAN